MSGILSANSALLAELTENSRDFLETAKSITATQMKAVPKSGEWSPAYVIHHMADADLHFATRYLFNIADDSPTISPFNEDVYPMRLHYAERDPKASLAAIEGVAKFTLDILAHISEADWARTSIHVEKGPITLSQIAALSSSHTKAHSNQIKDLLTHI